MSVEAGTPLWSGAAALFPVAAEAAIAAPAGAGAVQPAMPRGIVMHVLLALSRGIDRVTAVIGRWASWLILAAIFVSAGNAIIRKLFDASSNAWLELQWLLFGSAWFLAASYTLQRNEHIRIDIVSNLFSKRVRNWIDLFGHVFMLIPLTLLMLREATKWALESFTSAQDLLSFGGLPLWPAKAMIVIGFAMLFVQALSEIVKRIAIMRGLIADEHETHGHAPPLALAGEAGEPEARA